MMTLQNELILRKASDARWLKMRGESLFITGGTGLFGRWFTAALLDANRRLGTDIKATILTRDPATFLRNVPADYRQTGLRVLQGNVMDFTFPDGNFDRILHMATTSAHETYAGEDQLAKYHMLSLGTERVLQFAAASGVKKVLFTSSGVTYGSYPDSIQRVPESYQGAPNTLDPSSALGQGKRVAEFLCSCYAQKHLFEYSIARCFAFVGPGLPLDIHYAIGNFIRDALYSDTITVKGDGSPMRSFLYLDDLVHWLLALLVDGKHQTIYNVGSDYAISILNLAHLIRDTLAPDKPIKVLGQNNQNIGNFGRSWYVPDIQLARDSLGLDVWTSLNEAINKHAALIK